MSQVKRDADNATSYSVRLVRTEDGTEEIIVVEDYELLQELLNELEREAEDRGWFEPLPILADDEL